MAAEMRMLKVQVLGLFAALTLALFIPAGTIDWPAGWIFLVLFFSFTVAIGVWLQKYNPGLLKERMGGLIQCKQKMWDKVLIVIMELLFLLG